MKLYIVALITLVLANTLDNLNIRAIVKQRNKLFQQLKNTTVQQLEEVEDIIRQSLDIYTKIVESNSTANFDQMMDEIVTCYQKYILAHKTIVHLQDQKEIPKQVNKTLVDHLMDDVKEKADDVVQDKTDDFTLKQAENTTSIETVIKVPSEHTESHVLIDSKNNQYVLSKSGDVTVAIEDASFLRDIAMLLIACFCATVGMYLVRLPMFFGYILAGVFMSLNKLITHIVQVETIARGLGSIFIMFYLGLEFSPSKLQKVWGISLVGSLLLLLLTLVICVVVGEQFGAKINECIVIGACLFLSSTAVVLNLLDPKEMETGYGRSIMGILVCQDIMLGFLLALMPVLKYSDNGWIQVVYTLGKLVGYLGLFLLIAGIVHFPFKFGLSRLKNTELFCLTSLAYCLVIAQLGEYCNQSLELSCFVAGMFISKSAVAERVEKVLHGLKIIFGGLFFASIGAHIYPSFLIQEGFLLLALTIIVILGKIIIASGVTRFIFRRSFKTSIVIAVGLGQVSEFTFVLASKAKSQGLLNREAFFLVVGIVTMSMIASPLLWKLVTPLKTEDKVIYDDVEQVLISFDKSQ